MANKFGKRPSEVLEIEDSAVAFDLDLAAAVLLHKRELKEQRNFALMIATYAATLVSGGKIEMDD